MKLPYCAHKLRLARAGRAAHPIAMSRRFLPVLLSLSVLVGIARATEHPPLHKMKVMVAPPVADSDLTTYYVGLLAKGPRAGDGTREEREKTQAEQTAYINRLAQERKLLVAGPIVDRSEWRGIYIFKCASLAEAQVLAADDPEVRAGRLTIEIHPWMTERGSVRDPEFSASK